MTFKYDTKKIGEAHYVVSSRLVREKGAPPDGILEHGRPFGQPLRDANGKLRWQVVTNQDGPTPLLFVENPIPMTTEEHERKAQAARDRMILREVGLPKVVRALAAILDGNWDLATEIARRVKEIDAGGPSHA